MAQDSVYQLYEELQRYVGWTAADVARVARLRPLVVGEFPALVDDFYAEIVRHPAALKVVAGGQAQIERLKRTLNTWLTELFTGPYDEVFVYRRFRVGCRHVEIGLDQYYASVALARIRSRLLDVIHVAWDGGDDDKHACQRALNRLIDLDAAMIEYAYHLESATREQRQERLITLGKVSAGIAHELRNPLNAMRTSVWYLQNAEAPSAEKIREHYDRLTRQIEISDSVITALSRYARLPEPDMVPVNLCELVQAALERNPVPESIEVELNPPDHVPDVAGDREQLVIVLGNLIRNACEAMPDGGRLTLRGQLLAGAQDPTGAGRTRFAISVIDSGHGIEPDDLHRIMQPLFSTKARGIGLGLSLAQSIVERHGGELSVTSRPGHGTTFTITLTTASQSGTDSTRQDEDTVSFKRQNRTDA